MISQSGTGCGDPGGPPTTRCVVTPLVLGGRPAEVGARVLGEERELVSLRTLSTGMTWADFPASFLP